MANKLRAHFEGLSIPALFDGVLAKDDLVTIVDDGQVRLAEDDDFVVGHVLKPPKADQAQGTIETRFRALIEIKAGEDLFAGQFVKAGAKDSGGNRVEYWRDDEDPERLIIGIVWRDVASGSMAEVLMF